MTYKEAAQLIEKAKMQQITGFIFMFDMSLRRSLSDGKTTFKIEKPEIDVLDAREILVKQYPWHRISDQRLPQISQRS